MAKTLDLFPSDPKPRTPRVVRMHMVDAGEAPGRMSGWKTAQGAHFKCCRCGHDDDWTFDLTITEIKRGLPCPKCNGDISAKEKSTTPTRRTHSQTHEGSAGRVGRS